MTDLLLPPELAVDNEPFDDDELEAHLSAVVDLGDDLTAAPTGPVVGWQVTDLGSADWALRKYASAEASHREVTDHAAECIRRITEWRDRETSKLDKRMAFWEAQLADFQRRRREADPRAKTLELPSGRVTSTKKPAKVVVVDEEAVIAWAWNAEVYDKVIKREESVRLTELRKVVTAVEAGVVHSETGGFVPGVNVQPESVDFMVVAS